MRFLIDLGKALHAFGSPSHRIEGALTAIARRLGLTAQFFSTPTAIFASIGRQELSETFLVRADPGSVDLERMARLEEVLNGIEANALPVSRASIEVKSILDAPERYGKALTTFAFGLASGSAARFFGGGWREMLAAAMLGWVIGLLALWAQRSAGFGRLFAPAAALLASLAASAALAAGGGFAPFLVILASLIALIPGLSLTVAMAELANRHLVSGSARLAGAVLVFFTLGVGVALGQEIARRLFDPLAVVEPVALPVWTEWPALAVSAFALSILFRARPRDVVWVLLGCTVAVQSGRLGAVLLGPELGAFVGALSIGLAGNIFARSVHRPAAVLHLPGLMLLVPGSLGLRSVSFLLARDATAGVQAAFAMTLVASALVTGLLIANVLFPSKQHL